MTVSPFTLFLLLCCGSAAASRVESGLLHEHARLAREDDRRQVVDKAVPEERQSPRERQVDDPSGGMEEESLSGGWTPMSTWKSMWHPYLVLFWMHVISASLATVASLHFPRVLLVIMACSGLLWPISWMFGLYLWDPKHAPLSSDWWMTFIKWLIVDASAGLPVLACKGFDFSKKTVVAIGIGIYVILGANIVWTMLYKVDGYVRMWNTCVGGVLTVSLAVYCFAQSWHGKPLLEMVNGFPYGRGTSLPWLISYTVWNALFVMDFSMGMTLQDLLFWAMMYFYQCNDSQPLTIEFYFAFARPIQLGVYIAWGCWCGIVPLFRNAVPLAKHAPLHVNEHSYFLFIVSANLLLALYTLGRAIQLLIHGPPEAPMVKRLTQVARG
eukprot:CAMPEP_0197869914 /NCGR_PEP_ID=MMETSP1439-20131203/706_1 /TAXON_ID=66791 /ORGANISM="Gonyaulax spinifera, Strain CCMP409" /LENGTH=382 /DNA_ID=CAMNT_0043488777 /DNA_START=41 /DNA_END=1189 /DNA_ORIENTATION=+